jgi:hypothetical protein
MSSIEIYAELLNNIRAVSLVITLQTESNQETKASISADGQTITVSHEGRSASIRLPTQMEGGGTATLTLPAAPSKTLTLRLQLEETAPGLLKPGEDSSENVAPWSATDLTGLCISCRDCGVGLLRDDAVCEWRDLPNENWAEMMDFWHCHKPHDDDEHESHEEVARKKGYSSSDHFYSTPGLGFVALSYLLLAEGDCQNINVSEACPFFSLSIFLPLCRELRVIKKETFYRASCSLLWQSLRYKHPRITIDILAGSAPRNRVIAFVVIASGFLDPPAVGLDDLAASFQDLQRRNS